MSHPGSPNRGYPGHFESRPPALPAEALMGGFDQAKVLGPDKHDEYMAGIPYNQAVLEAYARTKRGVEGEIKAGQLFAVHMMPPLEAYNDDILNLFAAYQAMQAADLAPEVVFTPARFKMGDWSALQSGAPVPYKVEARKDAAVINQTYEVPLDLEMPRVETRQTGRLVDTWSFRSDVHFGSCDPLADLDVDDDERNWEIGLVSGTNSVAVADVSAIGGATHMGLKEIRDALGVDGSLSDGEAVALLSPTQAMYNAQQWKRISSGLPPVDILTTTMQRENLSSALTCAGSWLVSQAAVLASFEDVMYRGGSYGLRPAVRGAELKYFLQ